MFQTWKNVTNSEIAVFVPMHVIFEHRASDAYELGESALPATSLLRTERQMVPAPTRLSESRESSACEPGESVLLTAPLTRNEAALISPAPRMEHDVALVSLAPRMENDVAVPVEPVPTIEPEARPVTLTQVKFRQVLIEVDDPAAFWDGIVGGQVAAIEEQRPLSAAQIFALFEDAVRDLELSETWLTGYLLGLSDALLRQRKMHPRAYTALLKALK